jgi:hypothetical protein
MSGWGQTRTPSISLPCGRDYGTRPYRDEDRALVVAARTDAREWGLAIASVIVGLFLVFGLGVLRKKRTVPVVEPAGMARESFTGVGLTGSELASARAVCGPMRQATPPVPAITEPSQ